MDLLRNRKIKTRINCLIVSSQINQKDLKHLKYAFKSGLVILLSLLYLELDKALVHTLHSWRGQDLRGGADQHSAQVVLTQYNAPSLS